MKALVLNGGAVKGAFITGCLKHLLGDLQIKYDVLAGVSVGAINLGFISQFPHGEEKIASEELEKIWLSLNTKSIYKNWLIPYWSAIWKSSFYDSSPLINLINNNISLEKIRNSGKKVSVGAVSISSGKYTIFTEQDDDFIDAIAASSAFPGMLCPIKMRNQLWADGGLKTMSSLKAAIDAGATEIDLIMTSPETRVKHFIENPTVIDILNRSLDLASDKIMSNDLEKLEMYNKLALTGYADKKFIKMNVIRPKFNLIDNLLDFDPIKIKKMMEIGYLDAQEQYPGQ